MRRVFSTPRFERRLETFLRRHPELTASTKRVMTALAGDRHPASMKVHKLGGVLKDCLGASLSYEYRVIFVLEADAIYFIDIGSHDDVYR